MRQALGSGVAESETSQRQTAEERRSPESEWCRATRAAKRGSGVTFQVEGGRCVRVCHERRRPQVLSGIVRDGLKTKEGVRTGLRDRATEERA